MKRFSVCREYGDWGNDLDLRLLDDETREYALPLVMEKGQQGVRLPVMASLTSDMAQSLMDGLYNCGVRPSSGAGSAGQLAATEKHLEDMRRLVFEPPIMTVVNQEVKG
jgi:hypothetical protein